MGGESGRGRVGSGQTFCPQSRVGSGQGFVGSKKSGPWSTTLQCGAFVVEFLINTCCIPSGPYDFMQSPQEGQVSRLSDDNLLSQKVIIVSKQVTQHLRMRKYLAWPRPECKSELIVGARANNQRDHKDPGYCTKQNLVCRGRQKAEYDPAGNSDIKSQHKGRRSIKREIKSRRRESEHCRHLAIIIVLQHRSKTTLNQARLDNICHLANLMKTKWSIRRYYTHRNWVNKKTFHLFIQTMMVVLSGNKPREEVIEQIKQLCNHLMEDFEQNKESNEDGC